MTTNGEPKSRMFGLGVGGGLVAGLLASACCIGPLLAVFLGITGAGALAQLEPYRPYFGVMMFGFLAIGFYIAYRRPKTMDGTCGPCCSPSRRRIQQIGLWVATLVALGLFFVPNLLILVLE
jgi:mercuric ion transport protein